MNDKQDRTLTARQAMVERKQARRKQDTAATLNKMYQMNFEGNIIPHSWYEHLKRENGKPHTVAVILLSEVVYWYRPTEIRDESTGQVIGLQKRFRADKLQRNYQSFVDQFGFTKRQVKDALKYLETLEIIDLDFRDIPTGNGDALGNVLFIGLNPDRLAEITYPVLEAQQEEPLDDEMPDPPSVPPETDPSDVITTEVCRSNDRGVTLERLANTEITTETTTERKESNSKALCASVSTSPPDPKEPIVWEEPEGSELVEAMIAELSQTFGDVHHLQSNITRAYNLWNETSLGEHEFVAKVEEAAAKTKEAIGKSMVKQRSKRMAYFFSVLENALMK